MRTSEFLRSVEASCTGTMDRRELIRHVATLLAGAAVGASGKLEAQQQAAGTDRFFPGFKASKVQTSGATINLVSGGSGPPLLLLHGAPQSHVSWRLIAPQLATEFTVIATDLGGYADSSKPADGDNHVNYSKRAMALDQVEVMKHFGFDRFAVVGHDRGARVTHRMALDHPDKVTKAAVLDIIPTYYLYTHVDIQFIQAYFHWFQNVRPMPIPENSIKADVEAGAARATTDVQLEYLRINRDPVNIHGMCEDYRAGASIDLDHDRADLDHKIACPLLALWGERGAMGRLYKPLDIWRERGSKVTGKGLPGGHNLQEEVPDLVLAEIRSFLRA